MTESTRKRKREDTGLKKRVESKPLNKERQPHYGRRPTSSDRNTIAKQHDKTLAKSDRSKDMRSSKEGSSSRNAWRVTEPIGGALSDLDPVFTGDERHILLACPSAVRVLSLADSSCVRTLSLTSNGQKHSVVSGLALSTTNPEWLYISTYQGLVQKWDWTEGRKLGKWDLKSAIRGIAVGSQESSQGLIDVVFTQDHVSRDKTRISAHKLMCGNSASGTESKTLLQMTKWIDSFKIVVKGKVIIATSGPLIIVGYSPEGPTSPLKETKYNWREFSSPDPIASMDLQQITPTTSGAKKAAKSKMAGMKDAVINLVVGDDKGAVFVHTDILKKLITVEQQGVVALDGSLAPRRLHWHRERVNSVRWSHDGNYVISGGAEATLVLWQLDTEQRQYLPNLPASIESIAVSPPGSSYAVRLSDNSCMVLSTAELTPTANFAGIQTLRLQRLTPVCEALAKRINSGGGSGGGSGAGLSPYLLFPPPLALNPLAPHQLLVAVPSSQDATHIADSRIGCPYLQTFDHVANVHISRQALTRTNATNRRIGPDAQQIGEPVVKHLQLSADGHWLASIDEWTPPVKDLTHLVVVSGDMRQVQDRRREVYLKFWSRNDDDTEWELVSRIDNPHASGDGVIAGGRVLDMISDPTRAGFVTVGEDGSVRTWRPQPRLRGNVAVKAKGKDGDVKQLWSWTCRHAAKLNGTRPSVGLVTHGARPHYHKLSARLAYSADGSVVAVAHQAPTTNNLGVVDFLDSTRGEVRFCRAGLFAGPVLALGFVQQHLIILSEQLVVWNTVTDRVECSLALHTTDLSHADFAAATHLATDPVNGTFAVALPIGTQSNIDAETRAKMSPEQLLRIAHSQVVLFNAASPAPLHRLSFPHIVIALKHIPGSRDFLALDTEAELRRLSPRKQALAVPGKTGTYSTTVEARDASSSAIGAAFNDFTAGKVGESAVEDESSDDDEENDITKPSVTQPPGLGYEDALEANDVPVVRPQQLAEVFDMGPAYSMPRVEDLFEQVAGLFARKSTAVN